MESLLQIQGSKSLHVGAFREFCCEKLDDLNLILAEYSSSRVETNCTITSGWTNTRNRALISFLVSCPKDTMFLKLVYTSKQN